jgi:asparagine synthase (glutamine-hydrolysing)
MCENLYGVFGFILFDSNKKRVYTGRDTYGVRPVFRSLTETGTLTICSEAKGLLRLQLNNQQPKISQIKPGSFEEYSLEPTNNNNNYKIQFVREYRFHVIGNVPKYDVNVKLIPDDVYENIRNCLTNAVKTRLMGERRIGCLLSGGLDSSLISGLLVQEARKAGITYPIQTFSIGMGEESPDVLAARKVAAHLKTEHHEVIFSEQDAIDAVKSVIKSLESYDVTTIRASIGMFVFNFIKINEKIKINCSFLKKKRYLLSKYIKEKTDTVVIFSGEGADEVCQGYIYFYKAPTPKEAHEESLRLCNDLYLYDVCRADRTTAAHGLELRVPFLDHFFTAYYFSLPEQIRTATKDKCEKYLIRKAFDNLNIIPNDILWRPKEAFSGKNP